MSFRTTTRASSEWKKKRSASTAPARAPRLRADGDRNPLHRVVRVAADVPERLERLFDPRLVAGALADRVVARLCIPAEAEAAPRPAFAAIGLQLGRSPGRAAVHADVDRLDGRVARPRAALEHALARRDGAVAGEELRDPGWHDERPRQHARERLALVVLLLPQPVALRVLVAAERLGEHLDLREA